MVEYASLRKRGAKKGTEQGLRKGKIKKVEKTFKKYLTKGKASDIIAKLTKR